MKPVRSVAMAFALLASAARGEDASIDARRVVREALAERALGPVAPPVLPVFLPGSPEEPGKRPQPQPRPAPGSVPHEPGRPGAPAPSSKAPTSGGNEPSEREGSHGAMSRSGQREAVDAAAREAHRLRADEANRAAAGSAVNGSSSESAHGSSDCRDAAGAMRSMGMDPEHTGDGHHGGMMPDSGSPTPGGHH